MIDKLALEQYMHALVVGTTTSSIKFGYLEPSKHFKEQKIGENSPSIWDSFSSTSKNRLFKCSKDKGVE